MKQENFLKRIKKESYPKLVKRAWKAWSLKRRKEIMDSNGYVTCVTCGKVENYKNVDLGHFIDGKLDFHLQNTGPQCTRCNRFLHGNLGVYAVYLDKTYGEGAAERLIALGKKEKPRPYSREELIEIITN